jgi:hypothetical protein
MTRFCLWCASEYTPKRNATKKRPHLYCQKKCRNAHYMKEQRDKIRNAHKSIDRKSTK